jgi:hypothetical protein
MRRHALVLLCCAVIGVARVAEACELFRGDENLLPGELLGKTWTKTKLPDKGDVNAALAQLDEQDIPAVRKIDLNGDGRPELLMTSSDGRLCGNAGCPYQLLAPQSFKRIGEFFGHLAILDERVNGYRIIQSFSRYLSSLTRLDTYVFDGKAYRLVAHAIVDQCGLEQWSRRLRKPD